MKKEEAAKILAVKYVLDLNTFKKSEKLTKDLTNIHFMYSGDEEFDRLFEKYCEQLRESSEETPRWARLIMAERYSLRV